MTHSLESLLEALSVAGDALAQARDHANEIADQHPLLKELAIIRVMKRDTISSNAAKDIVKSDVEFMQHCVGRREAGVAVIRAETEYEVAKARVTNASLITPSTLELQQMADELLAKNQENARTITDLESKLRVSMRQTDLNAIAVRRANRYLRDRISDVDDLTRVNQDLSAQLSVEPRKIPLTVDTLEQSRESLTAQAYTAQAVPPHESAGDAYTAQVIT